MEFVGVLRFPLSVLATARRHVGMVYVLNIIQCICFMCFPSVNFVVIVLTLEVADWFWLIQEMTVEAGEKTSSGVWVLMNDGLWAGTPCWLYRCSVFVEGISSALSPANISMSVPMYLYMVEMYRFYSLIPPDRCLRRQTKAARIGDGKQTSLVCWSGSWKENLAGLGIICLSRLALGGLYW